MLDHYAEMGVNGVWINPVYRRSKSQRKSGNNGYGSFGPHLLDDKITGTNDIEKGFEEAKKFVQEAHKRNLRVFFDIVVWGVCQDSPLIKKYPYKLL